MSKETVHLAVETPKTTGKGTRHRSHAVRRIICGQRAYVLELASGSQTSYPRHAVEEMTIADEVDIVRMGNPA
jgi:hypothetical protein